MARNFGLSVEELRRQRAVEAAFRAGGEQAAAEARKDYNEKAAENRSRGTTAPDTAPREAAEFCRTHLPLLAVGFGGFVAPRWGGLESAAAVSMGGRGAGAGAGAGAGTSTSTGIDVQLLIPQRPSTMLGELVVACPDFGTRCWMAAVALRASRAAEVGAALIESQGVSHLLADGSSGNSGDGSGGLADASLPTQGTGPQGTISPQLATALGMSKAAAGAGCGPLLLRRGAATELLVLTALDAANSMTSAGADVYRAGLALEIVRGAVLSGDVVRRRLLLGGRGARAQDQIGMGLGVPREQDEARAAEETRQLREAIAPVFGDDLQVSAADALCEAMVSMCGTSDDGVATNSALVRADALVAISGVMAGMNARNAAALAGAGESGDRTGGGGVL